MSPGAEGDGWVDAYLERIGATRGSSLAELQHRHLLTVPFENLSIHLGEEIVLDEEALVSKIVQRRRGGFCYELNGAFSALLRQLGYDVTLLEARVIVDGGPGMPYDHLALKVGEYLVDVGFGRFSHYPLSLGERGEQADPGGVFRIVETAEGDLDVSCDGRPEYRLETRPRRLSDFKVGCWFHRTSPESHFTSSLVCSRLTEDGGRVSLSGRTLIITAPGGAQTRVALESDAEVLAAYHKHFGIELDEVPVNPARS
jgi:N-hydroxyarylamine O-acetyltransferase